MNKNLLVEGKYGHGARPIHSMRRWFHRVFKRLKVGQAAAPFNFQVGYDVRNTIGPITIKDQGQSFSCGGQAGSYFIEIRRRLQNIKEGAISAKSVYSPIAYPDGGTTIPQLETQIAVRGGELEVTVPSYDTLGQPLGEGEMQDKSWENPTTLKDALMRAGYTPIDVPVDIDSVATYIQQYGAVIWEIRGQNNGTWAGPMPKPPTSTNPNEIWTHFMCAMGASSYMSQDTIMALQSWGPSIGMNGVQYFNYEYFASGQILDCFTFAFDAGLSPVQGNNSIWGALVNWFKSLPWFPVSSPKMA